MPQSMSGLNKSTFMKKTALLHYLFAFTLLISFAACKKQGDGDSISTVNIQVKDATTGQPASGALVSLHRCANAGCAWGTVEEFRGTTDNDGICQVPSANYNNVPVWNDAIYDRAPRIHLHLIWEQVVV